MKRPREILVPWKNKSIKKCVILLFRSTYTYKEILKRTNSSYYKLYNIFYEFLNINIVRYLIIVEGGKQMLVELVKESITSDLVIGQDMTQTIIEGDILVPDSKPDIARVISVDGLIQMTKKEVAENKIGVEGNIKFKILYVSDKGEEPLYCIDSSTVFKQSIPLQGVTSKMRPEVNVDIEHIDFKINNERKIAVKAVINLEGKAVLENKKEITKDVAGLEDIEVLKKQISYTELVGDNTSEALIKDTFELDEDVVGIKEVLKWNASVIEKETKVTDDKVIIGGALYVEVFYLTEEEESTLSIIKREIPFTHFVEVPNAYGDMKYKLKLSVDELYTDVKENLQGERKILEIEAISKVNVKVMDTQVMELVVDAYSPSRKLKIQKEQIELKENIGMNRAHMIVRESLDKPATHPDLHRLFSIHAKPILTDYNVIEDKTVIEGVLETNVIYASEEGLQPLYSFSHEIPFRHFVDIDGLKEGMETNVDIFVEQIDYDILNDDQVDIRVNIGATCEAYKIKSIESIKQIEETDELYSTAEKPSLTLYFLQTGDTLWNVAKKYNTTIRQIVESNAIEDQDAIKPGDYIIIEKVHQFKF